MCRHDDHTADARTNRDALTGFVAPAAEPAPTDDKP